MGNGRSFAVYFSQSNVKRSTQYIDANSHVLACDNLNGTLGDRHKGCTNKHQNTTPVFHCSGKQTAKALPLLISIFWLAITFHLVSILFIARYRVYYTYGIL